MSEAALPRPASHAAPGPSPSLNPSSRTTSGVLLVLLLFSIITAVRHFSSPGADLSSSYVACRLLAEHQPDHLYSRDPRNYDKVGDPAWVRVAAQTGFTSATQLHSYVQIPLWAYSLQPLCTRTQFPAFNRIFIGATSLALAATLWLVARFWAPRLYHPGWIALICAALYLSEAYKYAMVLTQTHILFTLLTLIALLCARREQAVWAGALLALAAAVKITPGFLLLYWLVNRQWRASISFLGFSAVLAGASVLTTGLALNLAFLHNLSEISNILLVSWNNQSLAGFAMGGSYPASEQQLWHSLPLPPALKLACTLLSLGSTAFGGYLDRRADRLPGTSGSAHPPYGAALAILGATVFASIAWTHYYVILIFPYMLLLDAELRTRSRLLLATVLLVFAFNVDFQTLGGVLRRLELFPIVHAEFFSGLVCMAGLVYVSLTVGRRSRSSMRQAAGEPAEAYR